MNDLMTTPEYMICPFPIIGLVGKAGAGKSTAANIIAERCLGARIFPFARPLKRMIESLGIPKEWTRGSPEEKEKSRDMFCGKSTRHAMQTLGTEWGRKCLGNDFWVNVWVSDYKAWLVHTMDNDPTVVAIADDVRFANEADAIRALGGIVMYVDSPYRVRRTDDHASEDVDGIKVDTRITNYGPSRPLHEFSSEIMLAIEEMARKHNRLPAAYSSA